MARIDWVQPRPQPVIDEELGRRRAHAATLMTLALPVGTPFQGQGLGLPDVADIPIDAVRDRSRTGGAVKGRDGHRVPMPWQVEGRSFTFGGHTAASAGAVAGPYAVGAQLADGRSSLPLCGAALSLRHVLQTRETHLEWLSQDVDGAMHFHRAVG